MFSCIFPLDRIVKILVTISPRFRPANGTGRVYEGGLRGCSCSCRTTSKFEKHRILRVSREGHKRNWPRPRYGWCFPGSLNDNLLIFITDLYLENSSTYSDKNVKSSEFLRAQYIWSLFKFEVRRFLDKVINNETHHHKSCLSIWF